MVFFLIWFNQASKFISFLSEIRCFFYRYFFGIRERLVKDYLFEPYSSGLIRLTIATVFFP